MTNGDQNQPANNARGLSPQVIALGALSIFGLVGFIVAFGLIVARTAPSPQAAAPVVEHFVSAPGQPGPPGARGPAGPQGPRGPVGEAGIRVVRSDCVTGNCTVSCSDDEVLLTAHCGVGRAQAIYPTEHSALCRSPSRAKVEVVAACVKSSRR
jgi:hypothetical protein